jgi:hypothetical protein
MQKTTKYTIFRGFILNRDYIPNILKCCYFNAKEKSPVLQRIFCYCCSSPLLINDKKGDMFGGGGVI